MPDPKGILERELTNYACVFKGDTININHGGRDYPINIIDCKPNAQICVIETNINLDFDQPLDYVEPAPKRQGQVQAGSEGVTQTKQNNDKAELEEKRKEIMRMYKRLDGKALNEKQVQKLLQEYEEAKKREQEFDPRKHRLKHGIKNYVASIDDKFKGKGVKLS